MGNNEVHVLDFDACPLCVGDGYYDSWCPFCDGGNWIPKCFRSGCAAKEECKGCPVKKWCREDV